MGDMVVEKPATTTEPICVMTLEEHIEVAVGALTAVGLGLACITEYQALLVIAEAARIVHGHTNFDPHAAAEALIAAHPAALAEVYDVADDGHIH
jgi:hypothetical protein